MDSLATTTYVTQRTRALQAAVAEKQGALEGVRAELRQVDEHIAVSGSKDTEYCRKIGRTTLVGVLGAVATGATALSLFHAITPLGVGGAIACGLATVVAVGLQVRNGQRITRFRHETFESCCERSRLTFCATELRGEIAELQAETASLVLVDRASQAPTVVPTIETAQGHLHIGSLRVPVRGA